MKKKSPQKAAAKKTEIQELSEFIRDHMVTKDEFQEMRVSFGRRFDGIEADLAQIKTELRDIRRRLEVLEEQYKNIRGVTKEIDHLLQRVAIIEKRLGLKSRP